MYLLKDVKLIFNSCSTLVRMGSIPHGTTINAQCLVPTATIAGSPNISPRSIEPFVIKTNESDKTHNVSFNNMQVNHQREARLPQDLSKFIAAGTITQQLLDDPATMLRQHIKGQNILNFDVFTLSTDASLSQVPGGGTANVSTCVISTSIDDQYLAPSKDSSSNNHGHRLAFSWHHLNLTPTFPS